jgi:hypothetical protein
VTERGAKTWVLIDLLRMCACMRLCVCARECAHVFAYVCAHVCACVCMCVCLCLCVQGDGENGTTSPACQTVSAFGWFPGPLSFLVFVYLIYYLFVCLIVLLAALQGGFRAHSPPMLLSPSEHPNPTIPTPSTLFGKPKALIPNPYSPVP